MGMKPRHEALDVRVWNQDATEWLPLNPWKQLNLEHREDLSVDTMSFTVSDKHPVVPRLREHRRVPVLVTLEVNGVHWSGLVTNLTQSSGGEVTAQVASDDKHAHRIMARSRAASAVDTDATQVKGAVGRLLADFMADGAQRTGLPLYVLQEHEGDQVQLQVRSEQTVAEAVGEALAASDTYVSTRMLLPGMKLPGSATLYRTQGAAEYEWEKARLAAGAWPDAAVSSRLQRRVLPPVVAPVPPLSWLGSGLLGEDGKPLGEAVEGVAWVPFMLGDKDRGYWQDGDPAGVRVAKRADLWAARRAGWHEHVTKWAAGVFANAADLRFLDAAAKAGLLVKPSGAKLTAAGAKSYIGSGAAYAWSDGTRWYLANQSDFDAEDKRRNPQGPQRQTPGVLLHVHGGRDRRAEVLFSSAPGGGLEAWETVTTAPEAAMLHASAQLDEATLQAIKAGLLQTDSRVGQLPPAEAGKIIGSSNNLPDTVDTLDVSAQPFATVAGTDVSYSHLGGKVNINAAGPFFYREMNLSVSGSSNPVGEMGREWAKAQGSTAVNLTTGYATNAVFGDDIKSADGRTVFGWRPGDRVSFTDGKTRMSEVVAGYSLEANWDAPLRVAPLLGRQDNGVLDQVMRRVKRAEDNAERALLQAPRRVPSKEIDTRVDENPKVNEAYKAATDSEGTLAKLRDESRRASQQAGQYTAVASSHSAVSIDASERSLVASEKSQAASRESLKYSHEAGKHNEEAQGHAKEAFKASEESSVASRESRKYSEASQEASKVAGQHSESASKASQAADKASSAASAASDKAREHSEASKKYSEAAQADAGKAADASRASLEASGKSHQSAQAAQRASEQASASTAQSAAASATAVAHSAISVDYSERSKEFSEESSRFSKESGRYTEQAKGFSDSAKGFSESAGRHTEQAGKYSQSASAASQSAAQSSAAASAASKSAGESSKAAQGHSVAAGQASTAAAAASREAKGHSDAARASAQAAQGEVTKAQQASNASIAASNEAKGYSGSADSASKAAKKASEAALNAEVLTAEHLRLSEKARADAEESRRLAENAREAAESGRADAEKHRSNAFAAMDAANASWAAAEEARAKAEEARATAEAARQEAEISRAKAEADRKLAEDARDKAEGHRNQAEQDRSRAETARSGAESERGKAESARSAAETARSGAESARGLAESARDKAEGYRREAETARSQAETSRSQAERLRKEAEQFRNQAEQQRKDAESARDDAEKGRAAAEGYRASSFSAMTAANASWAAAEDSRMRAEDHRQVAESSRREAERARARAEESRDLADALRSEAEQHRIAAEKGRDDAETQRRLSFQAMAASQAAMTAAEFSRAEAELQRATAERDRARAETARSEAERARARADVQRDLADKARQAAFEAQQAAQIAEGNTAKNAKDAADALAETVAVNKYYSEREYDYLRHVQNEQWAKRTYSDVYFRNSDWEKISTDLCNIWLYPGSVEIEAKGKWVGRITVIVRLDSGSRNAMDLNSWFIDRGANSSRKVVHNRGAIDMRVSSVMVTTQVLLTDKQEFYVRVDPVIGRFIPEDNYFGDKLIQQFTIDPSGKLEIRRDLKANPDDLVETGKDGVYLPAKKTISGTNRQVYPPYVKLTSPV